jgi:hypothetical protein
VGSGGGAGGGGGGSIGTGSTSIKFCNALALQGNQNLKLTLNVADLVMVADSGTCSTPVGAACRTVAGGADGPGQPGRRHRAADRPGHRQHRHGRAVDDAWPRSTT